MIDPVIAGLIERVTRLEQANDLNTKMLLARIEPLEEALEQQRVDKEQAGRLEAANLSKQLKAAQTELQRLQGDGPNGAESR